jgi:hypothetical protein
MNCRAAVVRAVNSYPRACLQTTLSDSDPPKSPFAIPLPSPFLRGKPEDASLFFLPGTLTEFSPLFKGGWGGLRVCKHALVLIYPACELQFYAGVGARLSKEVCHCRLDDAAIKKLASSS